MRFSSGARTPRPTQSPPPPHKAAPTRRLEPIPPGGGSGFDRRGRYRLGFVQLSLERPLLALLPLELRLRRLQALRVPQLPLGDRLCLACRRAASVVQLLGGGLGALVGGAAGGVRLSREQLRLLLEAVRELLHLAAQLRLAATRVTGCGRSTGGSMSRVAHADKKGAGRVWLGSCGPGRARFKPRAPPSRVRFDASSSRPASTRALAPACTATRQCRKTERDGRGVRPSVLHTTALQDSTAQGAAAVAPTGRRRARARCWLPPARPRGA